MNVANGRLVAQHLAGKRLESPAEVVSSLGAIQAQDYLGALWAIGLRTETVAEDGVERSIAERAIVRTWAMRGTLHFVPAADVRWMLALLSPGIVARAAARRRQLGLDDAVLARARDVLARALRGGRHLSRPSVYEALERARISTAGQRGIHILMRFAQERLICFATREGKQRTFALLDEWVPASRAMERDEALATLAERYFGGHGPATLRDFAWWSGLAAGDARAALEMAKRSLVREVEGGRELWSSGAARRASRASAPAHLLPAFDELLVGYRDRSEAVDPKHEGRLHALLSPTILVDGRVVGTWTRSLVKESVVVKATFFGRPGRREAAALVRASERYGSFLGRRAVVA